MDSTRIDWSGHVLKVAKIECAWDGEEDGTTIDHHRVGTTNVISPLTATTRALPPGVSSTSPVGQLYSNVNDLVSNVRSLQEAVSFICHQLHRTGVIPE